LARVLHYVPALDEVQIIEDDGCVYETYNTNISVAALRNLKRLTKDYSVWDEDTQEVVEDSYDYFVIPHIYFLHLLNKGLVKCRLYDSKRIRSCLSIDVLDSKYDIK